MSSSHKVSKGVPRLKNSCLMAGVTSLSRLLSRLSPEQVLGGILWRRHVFLVRSLHILWLNAYAVVGGDCNCIARSCTWLYRLPQSQKQCVIFSKVYCYSCGKRKFVVVRRVGLMTRHEYRVDRPFPVTWLSNVWETTPPPPSAVWPGQTI